MPNGIDTPIEGNDNLVLSTGLIHSKDFINVMIAVLRIAKPYCQNGRRQKLTEEIIGSH